jgi:hypothetical protein
VQRVVATPTSRGLSTEIWFEGDIRQEAASWGKEGAKSQSGGIAEVRRRADVDVAR